MARMLGAIPAGRQCLCPHSPGATVVGGVMATTAIWRWELSVFKRLIPLTVAAFAVGTNTLVIAGLLPAIAQSLQVSVSRSEEHTSELQSRGHLVCRLLLEKKNRAS